MWLSSRPEGQPSGLQASFLPARETATGPSESSHPSRPSNFYYCTDPCFLAKPHLHLHTAGRTGRSSKVPATPFPFPRSQLTSHLSCLQGGAPLLPGWGYTSISTPGPSSPDSGLLSPPPLPNFSLRRPQPLKPSMASSKPQSPLPISAAQIFLEPETFKTNHLCDILPGNVPQASKAQSDPKWNSLPPSPPAYAFR